MVRLLVVLVFMMGCASSQEPASAGASDDDALPAPIDVCVSENGVLTATTASASRAGVYDPEAPIVPEHLNWSVPESFCVAYPGAATERARCGSRTTDAPVVARVHCAQ